MDGSNFDWNGKECNSIIENGSSFFKDEEEQKVYDQWSKTSDYGIASVNLYDKQICIKITLETQSKTSIIMYQSIVKDSNYKQVCIYIIVEMMNRNGRM